MIKKIPTVLLLVMVACWMPPTAHADQNDPRLDVLFSRLQTSHDFRRIQHYTQEIWRIWSIHDNSDAREELEEGVAELYDEDYTASLWHLNSAIDHVPQFAEAWNSRAVFYFRQGNYVASLADIEQTLKLEPRHFGALVGRGQCYFRLHKYKQALDSFERALAINPWLYQAQRNVDVLKALVAWQKASI